MDTRVRFRLIQFSQLNQYLIDNIEQLQNINKLLSFAYLQEEHKLEMYNLTTEQINLNSVPPIADIMNVIMYSEKRIYFDDKFLLVGYVGNFVACLAIIEKIDPVKSFSINNPIILNTQNHFIITSVVVHPIYRHKKFCQRICKILKKFVAERYNTYQIHLEVDRSNMYALRCYDKSRFKINKNVDVLDDSKRFAVMTYKNIN